MELCDFEERFDYLEYLGNTIYPDIVFNVYWLLHIKQFLLDTITLGVPIPYVYLISEDIIRAEWSLCGWEVSAVFEKTIKLHALHLELNSCAEKEIELIYPNKIKDFVEFIKQIELTSVVF